MQTMRTRTGKESSGLAILSMSSDKDIQDKILSKLEDVAYQIGKAIIDPKLKCPKNIRLAADSFILWAKSLDNKDKL